MKSKKQEGSILVLPDGASREDLISTQRFHGYLRQWAPYWYQDRDISNGALFVVTGCDKASDWAIATFPADSHTQPVELIYQWRPNAKSDWDICSNASTRTYFPAFAGLADQNRGERNQCIFIRSMRISLGEALWSSAVPHNGTLSGSHTTLPYKNPTMSYLAKEIVSTLQQFISPIDLEEKLQACHKVSHFFLGLLWRLKVFNH